MASSPEKYADTRIEAQLRRFSGLAAIVGCLIAAVALVGWATGLSVLTNFGAEISTMKANTAVSLLAAGLALGALRLELRPAWRSALGFSLAMVPTLVGALTLFEMARGRDLGIDQLLFLDAHPSQSTLHPGRMGINTALAVTMLGCALLLLDLQRINRSRVLQLPALVMGLIAFGAVIGYIDDIRGLYAISSYTGMSLPTSLALLALAVGCLLARPQAGFTTLISRSDAGSSLARRLLPLAICFPVLLDWLRLRGQAMDWYGPEGGVVMFMVANMICLLTFIILAVSPLNTMLSELRRSRSEVMTERATLAAILASADHCVISVDVDGVIMTFNRAAERWLGYDATELVGQQTPVLFHDQRELVVRARQLSAELRHPIDPGFDVFVAKARMGLTDEHEWTFVRKDGSRFPVSLRVTALRDYNGDIVGFVGIASDITERREVERLKNEFISTVSHELRTPLTSIRGSLALLEGGMVEGISEQARAMVHIAYNNCERLIRLINDILDVEKIAAGKMAFDFRDAALHPLVQECVTANQSYAAQRGVTLRLTDYAEGVRVSVDPDRFSQVMSNLLSNAAKFSPDGSAVDVTIGSGPRGVRVSVADRGAGVPEDFRDRIFSRFAQADASDRRRMGGTGLGLSICKAIVERMDGNMGYEPRSGGGSIFFFDLPLVAPLLAAHSTTETMADAPRILVCEDDADAAVELVEVLAGGGFRADIAPDAASARRRLKEKSYDAMTLDIVLPGEDGLSLLRSLRADPATARLPVVVVSLNAEEHAGAGMHGGTLTTLGWLGKPLDPERLLAVLHQGLPGDLQRRLRILHVEDDGDLRAVVANTLRSDADVTAAADLAEARAVLAAAQFDLVILDLMLPDGTGDRLVEELSQRHPDLPVLIFSAYDPSPSLAQQVAGVLAKSRTSNAELLQTIRKAVGRRPRGDSP